MSEPRSLLQNISNDPVRQKSFRKRKQDYVEALEMRVRELEAELEAHRQGSYCFDGLVASLIQDGSVACQS